MAAGTAALGMGVRLNGQRNRQSQLNQCVVYDQAKPN
jgi:hypothetical protein